jgi:WD40 repeat protein
MDYSAMFHGTPSATLVHPRYVKAVLPHPNGMPYILTGSEDEHIRVWDASNLERTNKTPLSVVVAHCGEVTAFGLWMSGSEVKVVSASLDGTLRRWSMKGTLRPRGVAHHSQSC